MKTCRGQACLYEGRGQVISDDVTLGLSIAGFTASVFLLLVLSGSAVMSQVYGSVAHKAHQANIRMLILQLQSDAVGWFVLTRAGSSASCTLSTHAVHEKGLWTRRNLKKGALERCMHALPSCSCKVGAQPKILKPSVGGGRKGAFTHASSSCS